MEFALKIGFFFCQVIVGYKNENWGVIEDFRKKEKEKVKKEREKNF